VRGGTDWLPLPNGVKFLLELGVVLFLKICFFYSDKAISRRACVLLTVRVKCFESKFNDKLPSRSASFKSAMSFGGAFRWVCRGNTERNHASLSLLAQTIKFFVFAIIGANKCRRKGDVALRFTLEAAHRCKCASVSDC
jgi:hypothetical protein